jgi:hypothetical protein
VAGAPQCGIDEEASAGEGRYEEAHDLFEEDGSVFHVSDISPNAPGAGSLA